MMFCVKSVPELGGWISDLDPFMRTFPYLGRND